MLTRYGSIASHWCKHGAPSRFCSSTIQLKFIQKEGRILNVDKKRKRQQFYYEWKDENRSHGRLEDVDNTIRLIGIKLHFYVTAVSKLQFEPQHVNYDSSIIKTSSVYNGHLLKAAVWEIGPWYCSNGKTTDRNFWPAGNPFDQWERWSFRQVNRHRESPQTALKNDNQSGRNSAWFRWPIQGLNRA